ncbi:MAG: periplasmic heavy metal sensor [Nitrospiraceae bacterium]|nr:MAG: periplasmic heavy metal sensor [Nitrospiraceae bacterium]
MMKGLNMRKNKHVILIIALLTALQMLAVTGCYRKTPEQRAEHVVRHLVETLELDADQRAKLEKMKETFLAKRSDMMKMRHEAMNDLNEMMLSPQLDQARLDARTEKIQAQTSDLVRFISTEFTELHDMLTPEQRSKLVEMMNKYEQRAHSW